MAERLSFDRYLIYFQQQYFYEKCISTLEIIFNFPNNYKWENNFYKDQLIFTCSKSTIETLEKGVKYIQS